MIFTGNISFSLSLTNNAEVCQLNPLSYPRDFITIMRHLNNLEQAIDSVLKANLPVTYITVLDAYQAIPRFKKASLAAKFHLQAVNALDRAMGKYPAADEITSSPFALHVANVRKEFWEDQIRYYKRYNLLQEGICSCCHATQEERIRRAMGVTDDVMNPSLRPLSQLTFTKRKSRKHRLDSSGKKKKLKSTPSVRQTKKKESHAFDAYGASTSARAM